MVTAAEGREWTATLLPIAHLARARDDAETWNQNTTTTRQSVEANGTGSWLEASKQI